MVAPGSPETVFRKFGFKAGVYRSTRIAWTSPLQVSQATFLACTGPQESRGTVPKCQSHEFPACTGLQESCRPVYLSQRVYPPGGYRSTGFAWTGPCSIREVNFGTGTSLPESCRPVHPLSVACNVRGVPVYANRVDWSTCVFRENH